MAQEMAGIYLHIPFCQTKCPYCDFYSIVGDVQRYQTYTQKLIEVIQKYQFPADTLYFGGGTPNLLGTDNLIRVIEAAKQQFGLGEAEITIETNPNSVTGQQLRLLRDAGVNRLSIGMQAANDCMLGKLGRKHTVEDTIKTVERAAKAGFKRISLDLMIGAFDQNYQDILQAVRLADRLAVTHLSVYLLKLEPSTPFGTEKIKKLCPDDDKQADFYLYAVDCLKKYGFDQYEISNFARDRDVSKHNLKYWNCTPYLGIGPSAHSLLDGKRFHFPRDIERFLKEDPTKLILQDGDGGDRQDQIMLGLRLSKGISLDYFQATPPFNRFAAQLQREGLATITAQKITLTPKGFLVSNAIIGELLDFL